MRSFRRHRPVLFALAFLSLGSLGACGEGSGASSPSATGGAGGEPAGPGTGGATGQGGAPASGGTGGSTITTTGGTGGGPTATGGSGAAGQSGAAGAGGTTGTGGTGAGGAKATGGTTGAGGARTGGAAGHTGTGGAAGHAGTGGSIGTGGTGGAAATTCNLSGAATSKTPNVYIIGDSTASIYTSDLYPRMGWAQPLQDWFAPACATIQDKALSGRSSKSFYDEGHWTPIKAALRAGDYVLIQFGHNDEKSDEPTLYTDPFTTYEQYLTIYISDTLAKGATPILITSIERNDWSNGMIQDSHGNYPVAMRQLAKAKNVLLVDDTALTTAYFDKLGQTATTALFMDLAPGQFPNYPTGNTDNTHLQEKGARAIAQIGMANMYQQGFALAHLLKAVPQSP